MKNAAIVFGITKNYTFALANVLLGMKKHCRYFWDDIIVYHDGIDEKEQQALNSILTCQFLLFDERMFSDEAIHSEALKGYSLLTLARFECFGLLKQYCKVIWHDVDILVQKDFSDLLLYGDKSGLAATQSDSFRNEQNFYGVMPGYDMLSKLYNAGLLVLSNRLEKPEELRVYCYNTYNEYAPKLRYNDQSVLNMMIQDYKIKVETIDLERYCCHPSVPSYRDAAIIHAYGTDKFWSSQKLEAQFPEWAKNHQEWRSIQKLYVPREKDAAPIISVLMSVYERTEFIAESVESILQQTFSDFELIVVVEKSEYQTQICAELEAFGDDRIIIVRNHERLGFSASLNIGLEVARGTYIARMDDDDISYPQRLEKEALFLNTHTEITTVGSWIRVFGKESRIERRPETHEELAVWAIKENPMFHPTVMMRKTDLDKYGFQYDPAWLTEDYDLWVRMMDKCKFATLPEVLLDYRASQQNATVTKSEKVADCHLDIMRRNMRNKFDLEFSRDEMLLLRQPSIVYECFNTDALKAMRSQVVQKIYQANAKTCIYDQTLLEKSLGEINLGLKTETKLKLNRFPHLYAIAKKIYHLFFKPETRFSVFTRIKRCLLPPSSKSFHNRMNFVESQMNRQMDMLVNLTSQLEQQRRQAIWTDEVVRRSYQETQAGFWAMCYRDTDPVLSNQFYRISKYSEYISALRILNELKIMLKLQRICVIDKNNTEWTAAASTLQLLVAEEACSSERHDITIASHAIENRSCSIARVCKASDVVLYYIFYEKCARDQSEALRTELAACKRQFAANGYTYYDLRAKIEDYWEIDPMYSKTAALFIRDTVYSTIKAQIENQLDRGKN